MADVEQTLLHEVVGHRGLRAEADAARMVAENEANQAVSCSSIVVA